MLLNAQQLATFLDKMLIFLQVMHECLGGHRTPSTLPTGSRAAWPCWVTGDWWGPWRVLAWKVTFQTNRAALDLLNLHHPIRLDNTCSRSLETTMPTCKLRHPASGQVSTSWCRLHQWVPITLNARRLPVLAHWRRHHSPHPGEYQLIPTTPVSIDSARHAFQR